MEHKFNNYRENEVYQTLEKIIERAGISITYEKVHDDSIDGEIWARNDGVNSIMMPEEADSFPDEETACRVLGHEMGHIMTGLHSIDGWPTVREINERTCDLIGAYLYRLAEMTYEQEIKEAFEASRQQDRTQ